MKINLRMKNALMEGGLISNFFEVVKLFTEKAIRFSRWIFINYMKVLNKGVLSTV